MPDAIAVIDKGESPPIICIDGGADFYDQPLPTKEGEHTTLQTSDGGIYLITLYKEGKE
jgi:hypothetical protein